MSDLYEYVREEEAGLQQGLIPPPSSNETNMPETKPIDTTPALLGEADPGQPVRFDQPDETELFIQPGRQDAFGGANGPADQDEAPPESGPEAAELLEQAEPAETTEAAENAEAAIPRNYYRDSTYTVVSLVSYLLGVPKGFF